VAARWPQYPRGAVPAPRAASGPQRGVRYRPITREPVTRYRRKRENIPLTGGQVTGIVGAGGGVTLKVGPQGLGNVWYPVQCTISTSTGAADTSTCAVYLGSQAQQNLQGGQSYAGGGDVVALSIASMSPGDLLIAIWTGATAGAIAAVNIQGTMEALIT
jgi:hypothetical protein